MPSLRKPCHPASGKWRFPILSFLIRSGHDYEVNLKAELEIMGLHEKLDQIRSQHLEELLRAQQEQLGLLAQLVGANGKAGARSSI